MLLGKNLPLIQMDLLDVMNVIPDIIGAIINVRNYLLTVPKWMMKIVNIVLTIPTLNKLEIT